MISARYFEMIKCSWFQSFGVFLRNNLKDEKKTAMKNEKSDEIFFFDKNFMIILWKFEKTQI